MNTAAVTPARASARPTAQLKDRGVTTLLPGQTPDGKYILALLLKRTFRIRAGEACDRADEDQPLLGGDVFWDTAMNSSVRMEADFVPMKLQTDVVLIANAHAPGGRATAQCLASIQVGDRRKHLLVTGDRQARFTSASAAPVFSDPVSFVDMPLLYERAYGGTDVFSDLATVMPYPRNPRGCGFVVANSKSSVEGLALPNVEDPQDLLVPERLCIGEYARWTEQPRPIGFAWVTKNWHPRCQLAGVMPADRATERELRAAYAKLVPADHRDAYVKHGLPDMNFAFFNGASEGLSFPFGAIGPGTAVRTANLTPEGRLDFQLPPDDPQIGVDIGSGMSNPGTCLHTVQIRLPDGELDMVWRAAVPYPGPDWLPRMRKLEIEVTAR
jgi:hypothetical protein